MRIVYLIHKTFYLNKLCRSRFLSVEEFCKKYNHELIYTGIGWGNFNENTFINENLKQLEPIDYIFCYKPNLYTGIHNVRYPKIIQYNEMYDILNTKEEIEKSRSDIIICHHENDVKKYDLVNKCIYHIPHCAASDIFYADESSQKKIDLLLIGAISGAYPLRIRLTNIVVGLNRRGWKCLIHKHPGYDCSEAHTNKYLKNMAHIIRSSRICMTCSSKYKYRLTKFIEIPMCGTALASDIPDEGVDDFKKFVIELDLTMSDIDIINKLEYYLKNENELKKKIDDGLEWSKNYTFDTYANILQQKLYKPNIYVHDYEGFNWICDRMINEWKKYYPNVVKNPNQADIIWLFTPWLWKTMDINILKQKKVITTIHHIYEPKFIVNNNDDIRDIDQFTDVYHVFDEYTRNKLYNWTKKPIIYKSYWCNPDIWKVIDSDKCCYIKKKTYGLDDNVFIIGSFIRDTEKNGNPKMEKGPDIFIKMVCYYRKILDTSKYKDIHVILTGFRRTWTINKLNELGIKYSYYEMVKPDVLNELYNILDLYIISSRVEGGPQSLYEATLAKCPIISSDVGNVHNVLNNDSIYNYMKIDDDDFIEPKTDVNGNYKRVSKYVINNYMYKFNQIFMID